VNQVVITEARTAGEFAEARALIEEYAAGLDIDLYFQDFSNEITNLSEMYGPPGGCLLLARADEECVGCVAVRTRDTGTCEMKRLYVRGHHRGTGLGKRLVEAALGSARRLGYSRMVLDTLPSMTEAHSLYKSFGFQEVDGYYPNPLSGVHYLARDLTDR
jgi:ribosomal protein S18 acetylase RimI-like enzyme